MKTILVVEKDPGQQVWIKKELTNEGYFVLCASNWDKAVQLVREESPDCLVMELRMPGMDLFETPPCFTEFGDRIPVVVFTSYPSYCQSFLTWQPAAYVVKSVDTTELKRQVATVVHHHNTNGKDTVRAWRSSNLNRADAALKNSVSC